MGRTQGGNAGALALVAACCDWPGCDARNARVRTAAEGFADWSAFLWTVERHRVAGLVHAAVGQAGLEMPGEILAALAKSAADIAHYNLDSAGETVRLQRALDRAGIKATFLKGVTLGERAFGDRALRYGKDIDVLVAPEQARACVALLESDGYLLYAPKPPISRRQWSMLLRFGKEAGMAGPRFQIEPHWRLSTNLRILPSAELARGTAKIGGQPVTVLHPDDEFAYLAVHGMESGWNRLKLLTDINALIVHLPGEEIERLLAHATRHRVGAAAMLALTLCSGTFGTAIPASIVEGARRSRGIRAARRIALANLAAESPWLSWRGNSAMQLHLAASDGRLASQLTSSLFALEDALALPLPRPLHFLYAPLRAPMALGRRAQRLFASGRVRG